MRDIDATIKQARSLGSEKRFMLSEIMALHKRAISEHGKFDSYKLIGDSFNFGFMLGYRMGKKNSPPDDLIDRVSCFQDNGLK